jgi:lactoylglutathione lyase
MGLGQGRMRTLHIGLRVADLQQSLAFYKAVGYEVVGEVPETPLGHLCMLKLPRDEFVTLELVHDPLGGAVEIGNGLSHFVIQVDALDSALSGLAAKGIAGSAEGSPDRTQEPRTAWITDPDGRRIELVQWPQGHPDGLTAADWPETS